MMIAKSLTISDESKELHCQEVKAKQKFHECELCKDGRAFVVSQYWEHIQDAHDGFFLRCSDCGEMFRSKKLRDDHALRHCNAGAHTEKQSKGSNELSPDCRQREYDEILPSPTSKKKKNVRNMVNSVGETTSRSGRKFLNSPAIPEANGDHILADSSDSDSDDDASCNECSHCGKIISSAASLSAHIKRNHTPVPCNICGIISPSSHSAKYHKTTKHRESKHKCPYCSKPFYRTQQFITHAAICKDRKFSCELCGKLFKTHRAIGFHQKDSCRPMKALKRNTNGVDTDTTDSLSPDNVQLARHAEPTLGPIVCPTCGMTFRHQERLRKHVAICEHRKKFPCEICGRNLGSLRLVMQHKLQNHPDEKNDLEMEITADETSGKLPVNPSAIIDSEQSSGQILTDSGRILQPNTKQISALQWCRICKISFPTYAKANYHKRRMHRKPKYECPHCSTTFYEDVPLKIHLAVCADRKFLCDLCGKKFKFQISIKRHMRRYHGVKGTLTPEDMDKTKKQNPKANEDSVTKKNSLAQAENASSESSCSCDICGLPFASTALKNNHVTMTHEEPGHKCPHCLKTFDISQFRIHLASCEVRRFPCDLCDFKFKRLGNLIRHMKKIHPGKEVSIKAPSFVENGNEKQQQTQNEASTLPKEIPIEQTKEHKLIWPQQPATKRHYSQLSVNKTSLLAVQTDAVRNEPQDDDIELKMDFDAEDTVLQDSQLPSNDNRAKSSTIAGTSQLGQSKNIQTAATLENRVKLENGIQVKEKRMDIKEEISTTSQSTSKPSERHGIPSERKESDQFGPCSICGLSFSTKYQMDDHMVVSHAEPRYKCSQCPKAFQSVDTHRRHEMMHRRLLS